MPEVKETLKKVLQHHAMAPIVEAKDLKDGQVLSMADGGKLTVAVADGKVTIEGANILGSVRGVNGIVPVVDKVLVPKATP